MSCIEPPCLRGAARAASLPFVPQRAVLSVSHRTSSGRALADAQRLEACPLRGHGTLLASLHVLEGVPSHTVSARIGARTSWASHFHVIKSIPVSNDHALPEASSSRVTHVPTGRRDRPTSACEGPVGPPHAPLLGSHRPRWARSDVAHVDSHANHVGQSKDRAVIMSTAETRPPSRQTASKGALRFWFA